MHKISIFFNSHDFKNLHKQFKDELEPADTEMGFLCAHYKIEGKITKDEVLGIAGSLDDGRTISRIYLDKSQIYNEPFLSTK